MHVISQKRLREFWSKHPGAEKALRAWWTIMKAATFTSSHDLREVFPTADFRTNGRVIFNIGPNADRLVLDMRYEFGRAFVVRVLTHAEYDRLKGGKIDEL